MPPTIALFLLSFAYVTARIYDRCELARELRFVHEFPVHEVSTWMCIVAHESIYDTAAMNPGSGDHGLFQISQLYWCSPPGDGFGCNAPCANFRDDSIIDDVKCVRRIFKEHSRISGDGFNAWAVYPIYCKGDNTRYVRGCFDDGIDNSVSYGEEDRPTNASSTEKPYSEEDDDDDDGYEFPPLPIAPKKALDDYITTSKSVNQIPSLTTTEVSSDDDVYEFPALPTTRKTLNSISSNEDIYKTTTTQKALSFKFFNENSFKYSPVYAFSTITTPTHTTKELFSSTSLSTPSTQPTARYITKKPYDLKVFTKATTSSRFRNAKQVTYRPFLGRPNVTVTLRPSIGPPRPPISPPRPPLRPRPTSSSRPVFSRPTTRPIRPGLNRTRPHIRFTTAYSNKDSVSSSTTTSATTGTKNVYTFSQTPPSTKKVSITVSSTTSSPASSSTNAKTLLNRYNIDGIKGAASKITATVKPPSFSNNGNNLKREERRYDNEFPGYFFSRIGTGFRLVRKL